MHRFWSCLCSRKCFRVDLCHHVFECEHTKKHRAEAKTLFQELPNVRLGRTLIRHLTKAPQRTDANIILMETSIRIMMGAVEFERELDDEVLKGFIVKKFLKIANIWLRAWDSYKTVLYEGIKQAPPPDDEAPDPDE